MDRIIQMSPAGMINWRETITDKLAQDLSFQWSEPNRFVRFISPEP